MAKKLTSHRLSDETLNTIDKLLALEKYYQRSPAFILETAIKLLAEREGITLPRPQP